jgi:PKD domain
MNFQTILVTALLSVALAACGGGSGGSSDGSATVLPPSNLNVAPTASAGANQSVMTGAIITLDGSASSDANSDPLTYAWTLTSKPAGSAATLALAMSAKPTFIADVAGTYVASVIVNDGKINSTAATVTVTAATVNAAPVADAGVSQNVVAGSVVTLDGSASSDANSDPLTYAWTLTAKPAGSTAALSLATSAKPTFTADVAGTYVANLIVNDGKVGSIAVTVSITAAVVNAAPVANAGIAQNVVTGSLVTLDGSTSSDANSDPLTYAWTLTSKPAGSSASLSSTTSAKPAFTADAAGTYVASLVVNDGKVNSSNVGTATITAAVLNVAPIANAGVAKNVLAGSVVTLDGRVSSDANGDPLTYAWTLTSKPSGSAAALTGTTSAMPTFTADVAGTYVASLIVNDGKVNSTATTVTVSAAVVNAAPVANAGVAKNVIAGSVVTLDGRASSDANSDPLTYAWTLTSKPSGSAAALTGTTSAMPTFTADAAGTYVASLIVNDGKVNSTATTVTVTAAVVNAAPVANAGVAKNVVAGSVVTLDGRASSDANSDSLTYAWTLTSKPSGSAAALTGTTSAMPTFTADAAGTYITTLVVNDGKVDSEPATVAVTAVAPTIPFSDTANRPGNINPGTVIHTSNNGYWVVISGTYYAVTQQTEPIYVYNNAGAATLSFLTSGVTFIVQPVIPIKVDRVNRPANMNPGTVLMATSGDIWTIVSGSYYSVVAATEAVVIYSSGADSKMSFDTTGVVMTVSKL